MKSSLFGLILCGGLSSRLGYPKHLVTKDQLELYNWWVHQLLLICNQVHISCSISQLSSINYPHTLVDQKDATGPLEGIYQAFQFNSNVDWLIVAVDLVHLTIKDLRLLVANNSDTFDVIAFSNPQTNAAFPLCCIYKKSAKDQIDLVYHGELKAPKMVLSHLNTKMIPVEDPIKLTGINTPEELSAWRLSTV